MNANEIVETIAASCALDGLDINDGETVDAVVK